MQNKVNIQLKYAAVIRSVTMVFDLQIIVHGFSCSACRFHLLETLHFRRLQNKTADTNFVNERK